MIHIRSASHFQGLPDCSGVRSVKDIFECRKCGSCCQGETTVTLDERDVAAMLAALKIGPVEAAAKYWRINGSVIQMKTVAGHCVFYDQGCTIHTGKPWRCRQWPLHPSIISERSSYEIIRAACPGINQDLSYEEFCRKFLAWQEKNDLAVGIGNAEG